MVAGGCQPQTVKIIYETFIMKVAKIALWIGYVNLLYIMMRMIELIIRSQFLWATAAGQFFL